MASTSVLQVSTGESSKRSSPERFRTRMKISLLLTLLLAPLGTHADFPAGEVTLDSLPGAAGGRK